MSTSTREIAPVERIDANLKVPGSGSLTARALLCSVLAEGECHLRFPLRSDDTLALSRALESLGYDIRWDDDLIRVQGRGGAIPVWEARLDVGDAGSAVRLLTALLSLGWGQYEIDGDDRVRERPVGELVEALGYLGAGARAAGPPGVEGHPPVVVEGAGLRGGKTFIRGERSGPFLSAVLLVSPYAENAVEIEVSDDLVSRSYVDLTVHVMGEFGVRVERDGYRRFQTPAGRKYRATDITIEGDATSASYFFAAAAITGGRVRIENLGYESHQGDVGFVDILERMGCRVEKGEGWTEVSGGELHGVEADLKDTPNLAPTLAVTSLFADGKTVLRNVEHFDEEGMNRIAGLTRELRRVGAGVRTRGGDLEIQPKNLKPVEVETYQDERMAMSFALIGLKAPGIRIRDPECVSRSFPDFFDYLEKLGQ